MGGCPICGRALDGGFAVYAPPSPDAFDTVECARRGTARISPAEPLILPTIDIVTSLGAPARSRVGATRRLAPVPLAVAAGLSLVAAGTASSLALWSNLPSSPTQASRSAAPAATATGATQAGAPREEDTSPPATAVAAPQPEPQPTAKKAAPRRFRGVFRLVPRETAPASEASDASAPTISVAWEPEPDAERPTIVGSEGKATGHRAPPAPSPERAPKEPPPAPPAPPPAPQPSPPSPPEISEGGRSPADHSAPSLPPQATDHEGEGGDDDDGGKKPKKPKKGDERS